MGELEAKLGEIEGAWLAIDTATPACSVALYREGGVWDKFCADARKHTQTLLPMVEAVLDESGCAREDLSGVVLSAGPGAFTGLRVGASLAQALSVALGIKLYAVSSLALLAASAGALTGRRSVVALLDARMGEVYAGWYVKEGGRWLMRGADRVCAPEALPIQWWADAPLVAGSGLVYEAQLLSAFAQLADCERRAEMALKAQYLFELLEDAECVAIESGVQLRYLRDEVAQVGGR
ncbi:tRNA (adenosine(37)-N6)-threonylcarbamoyltransferase complex dimerization subunit type 1 TsaB [Rappaport israeli]|uniref:tRNA (adenosine(37)-N6)-threonylcarbamoyltransferase complex dimerization subunit type 1 TsaB n=1 Tax=Rappaport israeli TaxID=1839807 RepID=UPI000930C8C0|nr:tRNA (adenosine(37)-N6)-threonylcarbamoyltransferase complex dimerization subunit type 1 TsaB [Rappaport israeli]